MATSAIGSATYAIGAGSTEGPSHHVGLPTVLDVIAVARLDRSTAIQVTRPTRAQPAVNSRVGGTTGGGRSDSFVLLTV